MGLAVEDMVKSVFVFRIDLFRSAMENITNKPTNAI
jgi:hypothetical protein